MTPSVAELYETARALSYAERAQLADELLHSLDDAAGDETRITVLREAVQAGFDSIDAGQGTEIAPEDLRDYIREIGREAAAVVKAKRA